MPPAPTIVLAFSGGLDTSYCVPVLIERGWRVVTLYVDTGGGSGHEAERIARRAHDLGASDHVTVDAADRLAERIVAPLVMAGALYQGRYPLLCADRYLIAEEMVRLAESIGAEAVAHGCTAMGNDQVRFDLALRSLTDLPIVAPIRELQGRTDTPRAHEQRYLERRGFELPAQSGRYSINENLLGTTASGSEIDELAAPAEDCRRLCAAPDQWPDRALRVRIGFGSGRAVSLDDEPMSGVELLAALNARLGAYGVGRDIYTGDTVVGLKGRIVFEAPGLTGLLVAHRALEELTLTPSQLSAKPGVAQQWAHLVFGGLYFDPARADLEALIVSSQRLVTGEVTLETSGGVVHAVGVEPRHPLVRAGATYAQSADWSADEARGFITLYGQASTLGARTLRADGAGARQPAGAP